MFDRMSTRAVGITDVTQNFEGPGIAKADRESRGAISTYRHSAGVFQYSLGLRHIISELRWSLKIGSHIAIAMACQFVSLGHDSLDEARVTFRNPPQCKKCALNSRIRKQL